MKSQFKVKRDSGNTKFPWIVYKLITGRGGLRYWRCVDYCKTKPEADEAMALLAARDQP